tara:strand:- start:6621 stop:7088 length:468 start_codon:yes stop_codon:yes gene_type:complete
MNRHTILFITNESVIGTNGNVYEYKDGIYNNRNNDETFIRWSGQIKNDGTDKLVLDRENIHIWSRYNRKKQYKYEGKVKDKMIFKLRDDQNTLIIDLFIEKQNVPININSISEIYDYKNEGGHKFQKYKMDCFTKLNLKPEGNWCSGIMEGIPSN